MAQIIPLTSAPNQTLTAVLNVNGRALTLQLRLCYNTQAGFWAMDISDQVGNPLVTSRPLLTGAWPAGNILEAFEYLRIGAAFIINQSGTGDIPNDTNLGTAFLLLWDDNEPVN